MSTTYRTRQGETVDLACFRHYGRTAEVTERALDANPGLAAKGPILPLGTEIVMPTIAQRTRARALTKLWE